MTALIVDPNSVYIQTVIVDGVQPNEAFSQVKPITYLKAHAAEMISGIAESREPYVITQNGEAKAVLQDVVTYEQTQETLALLKILALGNAQIEQKKTKSAKSVVKTIRERHAR